MENKIQKQIGLIAVLTFVYSLIGLIITLVLYWMEDFSYMPWRNYISDLSVGPNNSDIAYHIMLLGIGVFTIFFTLLYRKYLLDQNKNKQLVFTLVLMGMICDFCLIIMPIFPLDFSKPTTATIHIIFGSLTFLSLGIYFIMVYLLNISSSLPKIINILSIVGAILNIAFSILLLLVEFTSILTRHPIIYLIEWGGFFVYAFWLMLIGINFIRDKK